MLIRAADMMGPGFGVNATDQGYFQQALGNKSFRSVLISLKFVYTDNPEHQFHQCLQSGSKEFSIIQTATEAPSCL